MIVNKITDHFYLFDGINFVIFSVRPDEKIHFFEQNLFRLNYVNRYYSGFKTTDENIELRGGSCQHAVLISDGKM